MAGSAKEIIWIGSSLEDLKSFPEAARKATGFALRAAQERFKAVSAKPLRGFGGASVLEMVENRDGDTYRTVYTVNFEEAVYVLHCFKKKSKSGIATPKQDLDVREDAIAKALPDIERFRRAGARVQQHVHIGFDSFCDTEWKLCSHILIMPDQTLILLRPISR